MRIAHAALLAALALAATAATASTPAMSASSAASAASLSTFVAADPAAPSAVPAATPAASNGIGDSNGTNGSNGDAPAPSGDPSADPSALADPAALVVPAVPADPAAADPAAVDPAAGTVAAAPASASPASASTPTSASTPSTTSTTGGGASAFLIAVLTLIFGRVPLFIFRVFSYTITATITLDFWSILYLSSLISLVGYLLVRYRLLNTYSRLQTPPPPPSRAPFDLQPDGTLDDDADRNKGYPDEFMNAFLSSIKVFGYLDKPVFHELARHLQTRKLKAGEILFDEDSDDRDFYVVVDGRVQIFVRGNSDNAQAYAQAQAHGYGHGAAGPGFYGPGSTQYGSEFDMGADGSVSDIDFDRNVSDDSDEDEEFSGHHLLNEVKQGETVSSLFTILSLFTEDFELPSTLVQPRQHQSHQSHHHGHGGSHSGHSHHGSTSGHPGPIVQAPPLPSAVHGLQGAVGDHVLAATSSGQSPSGTTFSPQSVFPGLQHRNSSAYSDLGALEAAATAAAPSSPQHTVHRDALTEEPASTDSASALATDAHSPQSTTATLPTAFGDHMQAPHAHPIHHRQKTKPRSVHPNIVARAATSTTLAVIPAQAFRKLTEKFPDAAAHIVQVILTRFQRVTFLTLYRYLGLSKELLRIERQVNQFSGYGLPSDLFPPEILHDLRLRTIRRRRDHNDANAAVDMEGRRSRRGTHASPTRGVAGRQRSKMPQGAPAVPLSSIGAGGVRQRRNIPRSGLADDASRHEMESDHGSVASSRLGGHGGHSSGLGVSGVASTAVPSGGGSRPSRVLNDEEDEAIKDAVFQCIAQLIGMQSSSKPAGLADRAGAAGPGLSLARHRSSSSAASVRSSPTNGTAPSMVDRIYYSRARVANWRSGMGSSSTGVGPSNTSTTTFSMGGGSGGGRGSFIDTPDDAASFISSRSNSVSSLSAESIDAPDIEIQFYEQGSTLVAEGERNAGLYFVLDGVLEASISSSQNQLFPNRESTASGFQDTAAGLRGDRRSSRRHLFLIHPGGLAGYLAAMTGHTSFVTIKAKTDVHVGFMSKQTLDKYIERYPGTLLCLAKRLVNQLSPLVFHIDVALEWGQVNAGQVLCRQGDPSSSIYIVLTGRLRAIVEHTRNGIGSLEILGEYGQLESVGEMEVLMDVPRASTIHAIRDTEIAVMPKTLFNALAIGHPEITMAISRIIAARSTRSITSGGFSRKLQESPAVPDILAGGADSGNNNVNLKTVAILPVTSIVPVVEFAERLRDALALVGAPVAMLSTATVMQSLGKHAFTRLGRLKLMSWLAEQEESHRLVLYVADGGVNSPWTQRAVRQADCILLVGLGDEDPAIGEFERLLIGMKTTARKELVLLHNERACIPGSTAQWLKNRLWVHAHHHVQMRVATPRVMDKSPQKQLTLVNLRTHFQQYYSRIYPIHASSADGHKTAGLNIYSGVRSDFARLARRLLNKSIGLVLGGGGARGMSHVGIIRAFEEAGIPVDMIGGTSIGSFVGGMYARENDHVSIFGRAKMFSSRMAATWRSLLDLTYPVTALLTGHEFNRSVWKVFLESQIEDCWLPYFAVTTNITWSRMEVHRTGYMWRFIRASMSLSGYIPPLCENGDMLLDGGYINNLPADVMRSLGAQTIVAIDVSLADDTSPINYGDSLSGWWVVLNRYNPFSRNYARIPNISDIQSRLAYVSSVKQLEDAKRLDGCLYLHPPTQPYTVMDFAKFQEIYDMGYEFGRGVVAGWAKDGILERAFGVRPDDGTGRKTFGGNRRASI
ncbi:hypothetical protein BC831DRAFT_549467 [Entophlyctis helioformis]|nr:hypothetical protein BC831DRAFT_549467 [Entophlyctis helioformis]